MTDAVEAVFSAALTVLLMLLTIAAGAAVLAGSFALVGPVVVLVLAGIGRLPGLVARGCVRLGLRLAARLPGPRRWHRWVAAHQKAPQSVRLRLVARRTVAPEVLHAVFVNAGTAEHVRIALVRRCEQLGGVAHVMPSVARAWGPVTYAWPLTYAADAVVVQHALRRCLSAVDRRALRGGYARLARLAGPEVVWAMELERVGSLEAMDPVVRGSMRSGDAGALLEWL